MRYGFKLVFKGDNMNLTKIEKQLDIVQKKCRARTITIEDINQFINKRVKPRLF